MRNKWFLLILSLVMIIAVSGCATMKKKFIRKKKEKYVRPVVYTQKDFVKTYSNTYYYKSHYTYWKTWHDELLNYLGGNAKRAKRSGEEAISHLQEMATYLEEPKKAELEEQINAFVGAVNQLEKDNYDPKNAAARMKVEKTRRIIQSNFYFNKVKEFIVEEEIDLSPVEYSAGQDQS